MSIHEVARHLNISIGTVSRALNNKPDVNPKTRERVLEAAKALGYSPNHAGRSLRQGRTGAVAFVMETSPETTDESAAFFMTLHCGIQSVTEAHGLDYVVLMCSEAQDPEAFMRRIAGRKLADGFILSATKRHDPRIEFLEGAEIPFVSLGRSLSGRTYAWMDIDFRGIAMASVDLLHAEGHRRIAITVPPNDANLGDIYLEGYREALAAHGLAFDEALVIRAPTHVGGGHRAAQAILGLAPRPTAVLLVNDLMAEGLYGGLRAGGLEPGRDVAVIGHRAIPQNAHLLPTLTSFRMSIFELGETLGRRLMGRLKPDGEPEAEDGPNLWPYEVVPGDSHRRA